MARGCGSRIEAGVYLECETSPNGQPLDHFLIDPPIAYEVASTRGVVIEEIDGVWHVFDYVGSKNYPHAADFLNECKMQGLSRYVTRKLEFYKLTVDSRILIVHNQAVLVNLQAYVDLAVLNPGLQRCGLHHQEANMFHFEYPAEQCSRYHWLLPGLDELDEEGYSHLYGVTPVLWRDFIGGAYATFPPTFPGRALYTAQDLENTTFEEYLEALPKAVWQRGLIASFPITNIGVVRGDSGRHHDVLAEVRTRNVEGRKEGTQQITVSEVDA